jgi:hypothetical protein
MCRGSSCVEGGVEANTSLFKRPGWKSVRVVVEKNEEKKKEEG